MIEALDSSWRRRSVNGTLSVLAAAVLSGHAAAGVFSISATGGTQQATSTGGNVAFTAQPWQVQADHGAGATVTFAAAPFIHTSDSAYQRNVELAVHLTADPSGVWGALGQVGADASDYQSEPAAEAVVQTESSGAGDAEFTVTVSMLVGNESTLAGGDYTTTITGTLSAK